MKKFASILFFFCLICCGLSRAQTFDLNQGRQSIASLDGLWRFHTGDNPEWANPNFDDSQWPLLRSDEDWANQGYKGYSGMAWYRFRVIVPAGEDSLSLLLPRIRTNSQVYANGSLIGAYGNMLPHPVPYGGKYHVVYPLPPASGTAQTYVIAIRVWQWPGWAKFSGGGSVNGGAMIGQTNVVESWDIALHHARLWNHSSSMILALLQLLAGIAALALFVLRRREREYLWFSAFILLSSVGNGWYSVYGAYRVLNIVLRTEFDYLLAACISVAEIAFYLYLLKGKRTTLFWTAVVCLVLLLVVDVALISGNRLVFHPTAQHAFGAFALHVFGALLRLPMYVWILALLFTRVRQNLPDARLLLAPVLLQKSVELFQQAALVTFTLGWQHKLGFSILLTNRPFAIGMQQAADALFLLAVLAILVHRFTRTRTQEERYASEFEAARQVQALLIPATAPSTPGFVVESVYVPAQEVGGDFFQIFPGDDESLLIVVGDVSGKGLKAAMTVSTIVGALHGCSLRTPAEVLAYVNRILHGRVSGFVTCCATLMTADDKMIIANAGHLPPYRNGEELVVAGALPLGILAEGSYEETHYQLAPGDRLTFVSDGVVEATNEKRELFGFERTQAISNQPASAIAEAAKRFGQEDDISVLSVTRTTHRKAAIA